MDEAGRSFVDLHRFESNERSRIWRETICANYLDLDIRFPSISAPGGLIVHEPVGSMTFSAIASVAQTHERTTRHMADDVDHLLAIMQLRGLTHIVQNGRTSLLKPGRFLVADGASPYRVEIPEEYQVFIVRIPRLFFEGAFAAKNDIVNACVDESRGSMVVVDYFRRMAVDFEQLTQKQRVSMSSFGMRLLTDTLATSL